VPAYGPQNDVTLKMPAFEWVHVQLHQQKGMISLSPPTICNSAMAENINGLYKAEVIHRKSWKNRAEVELATLTWVDWYNNRRLLERLGHTPPAEAEKAYYASIGNDDLAA
ncbi:integrase core domain-containing protein, partial [Escherichia coli]|nr:integrase core domain-containing protein [Escherichia coli]